MRTQHMVILAQYDLCGHKNGVFYRETNTRKQASANC